MGQYRVRSFVVGMLVAIMAVAAPAADVGRVLRSSVFPGMGQLGDDQTARGLLYMGGEILLLSLTVDQVVRKAAFDRSTEYLKAEMDTATVYENKYELEQQWIETIEDSDRAQMLSIAFGASAAVWWAWNIIDAIMFAPKSGDEALLRRIKKNTVVSVGLDKAQVSYLIDF
ncbi:MAG: hypothetical protein GF331_01580 [Chitinivibrionales bacterium]|nr:hypothetical protein [Chitinivibrionales bacterium]